MNNENKIVAGICLIFFIIIGYLFWMGPSINEPSQIAKDPNILVRPNSHMTRPASGVGQAGYKSAKVTMVEFGDYQCPACAVIYPEIEKVVEAYKTNPDFNYVFRNFPLSQHKNAMLAAEVAESAGDQGKYFEMEASLYKNQPEWGESADPMPFFTKYAISIGLDMIKFESDITQHKFLTAVQSDVADGTTLLVNHTPTVYINGLEQRDLTAEVVKAKIDELLAK